MYIPVRQKSVNVLAAINGEGSVLFEIDIGKLNSKNYKEILKMQFSLMKLDHFKFQQDGGSIHCSKKVVSFLEKSCKGRWIGLKSAKMIWAAHSPDLSPLDFYFLSEVKRRIAKKKPKTMKQFLN